MKKIFLLPLFVSGLLINAQTKQIIFETGLVSAALDKAKKENKLVFIDAYTTWCGPCKSMAKNVFTNDTVADYFNKTFINYKMDMEKGEGVEFAKKYQVKCYPNLLFIDGDGNLIHRGAGGLAPRFFIELASNSLNPDKAFTSQKNNIEKAGINESNVLSYVQMMANSCLDPFEPVKNYLAKTKNEELTKRTNWILLRDYMSDIQNPSLQYFISHIPDFESKFGKDTVAQKLWRLGSSYFEKYIYAKEPDNTAYEKAKKDFTALNWPGAKMALFNADLNMHSRFDLQKYYALAASDYLKYYGNDAGSLNSMAWTFYENVTDKAQLKSAVNMAKRACDLNGEYAYLDTYAAVLYKSGDNKEAEKMANKAIETAKAQKMGPEDYKETAELLKRIKSNLK